MDRKEKALDRPARLARVSLSFPAMMASVFLVPICLYILNIDLSDRDLYLKYFPLAAGFVVFFVWLITVLLPVLHIPTSSWMYRKTNPILVGILHAAAISIPLFLPFCLDQGEYHLVAIALLGGFFSGLNLYLLLQWPELLEALKRSFISRTIMFFSPLGIAALYYIVFPSISPHTAYPLMIDPIQDRIYLNELIKLEIGDPIEKVRRDFPKDRLSTSFDSEGPIYQYSKDGKGIKFRLQNDTIVAREVVYY